MEKERTLQEIADSICRRLKKKGFSILHYDAMSTDSIYLKLDYGVCNSIRIGGHRGKSKLKYRYNIGTNIKKKWNRSMTSSPGFTTRHQKRTS